MCPEPLPDLAGVRVLLLEDHADTRDLYSLLLALAGAEVTTAISAREALAGLDQTWPDVLVSDVSIPGFEDGLDLLGLLRNRDDVPAVAITAIESESIEARLASAGFREHLRIPVDPHELLAAVARVARQHVPASAPGAD